MTFSQNLINVFRVFRIVDFNWNVFGVYATGGNFGWISRASMILDETVQCSVALAEYSRSFPPSPKRVFSSVHLVVVSCSRAFLASGRTRVASVRRVSCHLRSRVFANERPTVASIFNVYGDSGECSR